MPTAVAARARTETKARSPPDEVPCPPGCCTEWVASKITGVPIFARIGNNRESFFTVSQGIFETNIVISSNLKEEIDRIFASEEMINSMSKLASITIKLPKTNLEQSGIYYFILKQLAWANIPVQEVISTTHEITLVVKEEDINKTFSILIDMKKS